MRVLLMLCVSTSSVLCFSGRGRQTICALVTGVQTCALPIYGNSLTFSAGYDDDYYPTSRAVSSIYSHTYDTDSNGNITQIGSTDYAYDEQIGRASSRVRGCQYV